MNPKIWLLYLILPGRFGAVLSGVLILAVMVLAFIVVTDVRSVFSSGALFFCAITAYIVPVFSYINRISVQAVDDLRALLDMPGEEVQRVRRSISHQSLGWNLLVTGLGLAGGFLHLYLIESGKGTSIAQELSSPRELMGDLGALIVWVVMTVTIFSLTQNAIRIGKLARKLRPINLFRIDKLLPFARVAIGSSLAVIGSFALYPLLFIDQDITIWTAVPGLISTAIPMVIMLLLPMWPAHKRIKTSKAEQLLRCNTQLDEALHHSVAEQSRLAEINHLLDHRQHLQRVPDWPIDIGAVSRLILYLIIPPVTWVGAALIENAVDALL